MNRVVILGRGAAGKSTFAAALGQRTDLPVIELDKHFWGPGLEPTAPDRWARKQAALAAADRWIMDGDLGPYDALWVRLERADTVIMLDFPVWLCAWRALRRGRENAAFWRWMLGWRAASRPKLLDDIRSHAPTARVHIFRSPQALSRFLASLSRT